MMVLNINGKNYDIAVEEGVDLLSVIRNDLDLTGSKYGCGQGSCGACTVLVNGKSAKSCVTMAASLAGKEIVTIEGLEKDGRLHPVQQAFLETDPFQCSYCAPGMIMSAVTLLKNNPLPTDTEIITAMNGNICRCGTYPNIIDAIRRASKA